MLGELGGGTATPRVSTTRPILEFLNERVARLDNPRSIGSALQGPEPGEFWKYRVTRDHAALDSFASDSIHAGVSLRYRTSGSMSAPLSQ